MIDKVNLKSLWVSSVFKFLGFLVIWGLVWEVFWIFLLGIVESLLLLYGYLL